MTLICGQNVSLEELKGKTSEIEALLAQGKAGLAQLQAKATEALTALESVKVPIPSVALPNLQNEINSIVTSLTGDLNTAVISLPAKIAELEATFSGLPSTQLQEHIDKITTIVNTAVSSGSLTGFDPCTLFPNIEVATDGAIVEKAKKIETPNTNPKKPEETAAVVKTVKEFEETQPQAKPSVISPSGLSFAEVDKRWTELEDSIWALTDVYWKGLNEAAVKEHADYIKANPGPRSEIIDLERNTGRKAQNLYVNGALSETAAKYYIREQVLSDVIDIIDQRSVIFYDVENEYLYYLVGEVSQYEWDEVVRKYSSNILYEDDYFKWVQIQNQWDKGKQTVIDWWHYNNINNKSGTTAQ